MSLCNAQNCLYGEVISVLDVMMDCSIQSICTETRLLLIPNCIASCFLFSHACFTENFTIVVQYTQNIVSC